MLPAGTDKIFPYKWSHVYMRLMAGYFKVRWPNYLMDLHREHRAEVSANGQSTNYIPSSLIEIFVYRNSTDKALWKKEGFSPATENTMLYILYDVNDTEFTIVHDEGTTDIIKELDDMFRANWCFV